MDYHIKVTDVDVTTRSIKTHIKNIQKNMVFIIASQQDELRARPVRTRITGQVRVCVMQTGQTCSCGARTHTHKHPRTDSDACCLLTRSLRSCPTLRLPPTPSSLSTQFRTVENLSTVTTLGLEVPVLASLPRRNQHPVLL